MANPLIGKLLAWTAAITVQVQDKPNGHLRVSVLGIPFYDSERQERRLARRRKRKQLDNAVATEEQCDAVPERPEKE